MATGISDDHYVVRSTRRDDAGRVSYELVDMAGAVVHCTIPFDHSTDERAHELLRAALASRHPAHKPVR